MALVLHTKTMAERTDTYQPSVACSMPLGYANSAATGSSIWHEIITNAGYDQIVMMVPGAENGGSYGRSVGTIA